MIDNSILIFGAGKIGRSFIGQLFSRAGYQVVFVDVDPTIVKDLNRRKSYPVIIKGEKKVETILVSNVRAVSGFDQDAVIKEIANTSIMAVSVGKNALEKIIPNIAKGLILRQEVSPGRPMDIIIAENMRSAKEFMYSRLTDALPVSYPLSTMVGLVETSIGKMVPIMTREELQDDPLAVFAEPYNTLILDKSGFRGTIPHVDGLCPKENMKAWVDRKAFIHNMGHATASYVGNFYYPDAVYMYQVLEKKNIRAFTRASMFQAAKILCSYYPREFSLTDLEIHIDDLLDRFQNRALKDTVFRVGQDVPRKLGIDDRFAGIIQMAKEKELEYNHIAKAMAYGFFFRRTNEHDKFNPEDALFMQTLKEKGVVEALTTMCNFHPEKNKNLLSELKNYYLKLLEERGN